MRLIDPIELKRSISLSTILEDAKTLEQIIDEQPTIEPERKTGQWFNDIRYSGWTCTNCHYHDGNKTDRYCPNCGSLMEVEHETDRCG